MLALSAAENDNSTAKNILFGILLTLDTDHSLFTTERLQRTACFDHIATKATPITQKAQPELRLCYINQTAK